MAGLSPSSDHKITEKDIQWSDLILVMEAEHRAKNKEQFLYINLPKIDNLNIEDEYEFMDEELVEILKDKINFLFI
ncbi:MAG: protein tyrosine phosphatase [bacterium]|nr:protein tyrosine phosphatase [bacterium]